MIDISYERERSRAKFCLSYVQIKIFDVNNTKIIKNSKMTGRRLTENGEDFNNLIQSPEITSTTSSPLDLLRIRCLSGGVFPQPRRSYRELPSTPAVQMFPNLSEIIPSNPREDREPNEPQNRIESMNLIPYP